MEKYKRKIDDGGAKQISQLTCETGMYLPPVKCLAFLILLKEQMREVG